MSTSISSKRLAIFVVWFNLDLDISNATVPPCYHHACFPILVTQASVWRVAYWRTTSSFNQVFLYAAAAMLLADLMYTLYSTAAAPSNTVLWGHRPPGTIFIFTSVRKGTWEVEGHPNFPPSLKRRDRSRRRAKYFDDPWKLETVSVQILYFNTGTSPSQHIVRTYSDNNI